MEGLTAPPQLEQIVMKRRPSFNIADVLELSARLGAPAVFDNLHNAVNCPDRSKSDMFWIDECEKTWKGAEKPQKIHYSQQDPMKKPGSHSSTVRIGEFLEFYSSLGAREPDIMLEVKDKNLSAVKCLNCISDERNIGKLEGEWSRYKYAVLERMPEAYRYIRALLRDEEAYPAVSFYSLIEKALSEKAAPVIHKRRFACMGYFKDSAAKGKRAVFLPAVEGPGDERRAAATYIKRMRFRLAEKNKTGALRRLFYFRLDNAS
jgi:UV DNA damage endonuclease